jgi:hypothetical protein
MQKTKFARIVERVCAQVKDDSAKLLVLGSLCLICLTPGVALAASTISLNETGQLHRTSHSGLKLNEQGSASGTIRGTMYVHLDVVSPNRVTAEVNIYPGGGSLTGSGSADYRVDGGTASFSGKLSIDRGTGTYAGAHGSGLSFSGTIQRLSGAVTVHLSGSMST